MANGEDAMLSGRTCLEQLIATFPQYPLYGANQAIRQNYPDNPSTLPKLSSIVGATVGDDVHILIGVNDSYDQTKPFLHNWSLLDPVLYQQDYPSLELN